MSEWWTYRPEDLLLFSPRTYWRLFELANAALWPLQILIIGAGMLMLIRVIRPTTGSDRMIAGAMALAWASAGLLFIGALYSEVNWAAAYAVPLFVAEAVLLFWFGVVGRDSRFTLGRDVAKALGCGLFAYALGLHPLVAPLAGRPIGAAEIVGIAPDPTAIATLGFLVASPRGNAIWLMLAIPTLWCLFSAATLFTMGAWEGGIPLAGSVLALLAVCLPRRR